MKAYSNLSRRERARLLAHVDETLTPKQAHIFAQRPFSRLSRGLQELVEQSLDPHEIACVDLGDRELSDQEDHALEVHVEGVPDYPRQVYVGDDVGTRYVERDEPVDDVHVEDLADDLHIGPVRAAVPNGPPSRMRKPVKLRLHKGALVVVGVPWILGSTMAGITSLTISLAIMIGGFALAFGVSKIPDLIRRYKLHRSIPCGARSSFVLVGGHRPGCTQAPDHEGDHQLWVLDDVEGPKLAVSWPRGRTTS